MFFGWYIVAAALLLTTYSSGMFIYGFTAFINPIAATFGWSYAQISLAISIRGMEVGALEPFMGIVVDRWPARRLMLIGVIISGLGILCISQATNLAMFYIGFLITGLGSSLGMFMVPQTTIARWFKRDLGKASGILAMGLGIGGSLLPLLVKIIDTYGWQTTLIYLAAGFCTLGIPLSFLFRNRPEEHGLLPDGKPQDYVMRPSRSKSYDFSTGAKEALKLRAFWHFSIASMLQVATVNAATVHVMPYFTSLGIERAKGSMFAMLIPLVSLPARIGFGWLADIFPKKYVAATSNLLTAVGLFLFWLIDGSSLSLVIMFVVIFGLGVGGSITLRAPIVREYFGTRRFGTILGMTGIFTTLGMITGTPLAGWVFDTLGFYDPIWLIFSGVSMIGVILFSTMPSASRSPMPNTS